MYAWPKADGRESDIIEQFKFLQDHLTTESAIKFCQESPGDGFLKEMYNARHLHCEGAFQSYLACLRVIALLVSRSDFLHMFPKSCSGCATLQILCILSLHPILENEVNSLFRELLCDPRGDVLDRNDIRQLVIMIRQGYKSQEDPFPQMGNCANFESESEGYKKAQAIGQLLSSEQFCQLMKSNSIVGSQLAHEMMKNLQDSTKQINQLKLLLSKYE